MKTLLISIAVALIAAGGCAQQPREPAPGPDHPANPRAATAPAPKLSATLNERDVPPVDATAQPPVASEEKAGEAYTCPHHPKVIEPTPGDCPFCGMALVPTESRQTSPVRSAPPTAQPDDHGHEGHGGHK